MTGRVAVDSSALIAVLNSEPEEKPFLAVLNEESLLIGWPTVLETRIWLRRWMGKSNPAWFEDWLGIAQPVIFDQRLEGIAHRAFDRFGKGLHRAALNFGDCMSYAVAMHHDAQLLFKGGDFGRTDVKVHPASVLL